MNEDSWAQGKSVQILSRGSDHAFSIFDSKWENEVAESLKIGGGMFWDSAMRGIDDVWTADNNRARIEAYCKDERVGWCADTLEELADKIDVPREEFIKTVNRYNELAAAGKDADFGKKAELLTSIDKPPYYALKFGPALLAVLCGLHTDRDLCVLDAENNRIEGLYAAGNIAGDIYTIDYPLTLPGNSHGHALTTGYVLGRTIK